MPYHLSSRKHPPEQLAGQVDARATCRSRALWIQLLQLRLAEALLGDRDRADVGGVREDLARRQCSVPCECASSIVARGAYSAYLRVRVGHRNGVLGRDRALLQRAP